MKIRTGFVSNSSSSSFIVAAKSEEDLNADVTFNINLAAFLDRYRDPIDNETDLRDFFEDVYYYNKEDIDDNEIFKECLAKIKEGKKIYFLSCESNGSDIESALCTIGLETATSDTIDIIEGEGGY